MDRVSACCSSSFNRSKRFSSSSGSPTDAGALTDRRRALLDQEAFENSLALLEDMQLLLAVQTELIVEAGQRREVDPGLLRELADVPRGKAAHVVFVMRELLLRLDQLSFQELRGSRRFLGPHAVVLRHIKRGDGVGDVRDGFTRLAGITEPERHGLGPSVDLLGPGQVDLNVPAALIEDRLHAPTPAQIRVEVEAFDELGQSRSTEDFLFDDLQPALELAAHSRLDEGLRHLTFDEHQCARLIEIGQVDGEGDG